MAKLRLDQAPPANLPLRFLLSVPVWGVLAGMLLLVDADAPLHARWHPATLALVHVYVLGVLGNAMFGALLQFPPAVAGVQLRGGGGVPWLHAWFNLAVVLLVTGLHFGAQWPLFAAGVMLPASFLWLAAMLLPGLVASAGERLLRTGMGAAIGFGLLTAIAGGGLAWMLAIRHGWSPALVDVHASLGVVGWIVLLLATVGRVTMPMFQGTGTVPARTQAWWLATVVTALVLALGWHLSRGGMALATTVALAGASFAGAVLWLQGHARGRRRNALFLHWRAGSVALLLAAPALLADVRGGLLAGVLALGVGLPLLVGGMVLEIVPFVGWIGLRRTVPRGVQLPGVQLLLPDAARRRVLLAQLVAALPLLAATLWSLPWLARLAGLALLIAWLLHGHALASALYAARRFRRAHAA
jgi:hypothetical protein